VTDGGGTEAGALRARKTWRTLEPLHGMIYFVPEAGEAYAALGVVGRAGYFASRAAPMGAVGADVVISTFFNFNPELVRDAIPDAWRAAAPEALVDARFHAADAAFRRLLGNAVVASGEMRRAASLARTAAEEAGRRPEGRPLAAAHADLGWPDEPHLQLWHAQSILREFRGDGHVALLVVHGLSGMESLITHAATGDVPAHVLRTSRGWSQERWGSAVEALRERGWLQGGDGLRLTDWGAAQRRAIEEGTDALATVAYAALGDEGCAELRALARPWSTVFAAQLPR
jgi:hypothetical protein